MPGDSVIRHGAEIGYVRTSEIVNPLVASAGMGAHRRGLARRGVGQP
jgi:hypothetical protein